MTTETETQVQEFSNSLIRFSTQLKSKCLLECTITATKELIDKAKTKSIHSLAKQITLPGFRKGKAPEAQIIQNFAQDIEKQTKNTVMHLATLECINLGKIPALDKLSLESRDQEPNMKWQMESFSYEETKFRVLFEIAPSVPSIDPSLFVAKAVERHPVTEEQVTERIRQALFFFASWNTISDRPVQEGDFLILDATIVENNSFLFQDTRFEVTDKSMAQWMKLAVLGKNTGDTVEATSVADEDLSPEEKQLFQPKKVSITIKKIELASIPALTEQLLSRLGVKSEEELKTQIEKMLNHEADTYVKEAMTEQVLEFLLTTYPFDLPESLIIKEANFRFNELAKDSKFVQEWESSNESEKKDLANLVTTQSKRAMQIFYLCQRLIQDAKISISSKESNPKEPLAGHFSKLAIEKATDYIILHAANKALS